MSQSIVSLFSQNLCVAFEFYGDSLGAGFVKFLGPYYMLVIKKRKKVGEICGHTVYGVVGSQMIMIPYHSGETRVAGSAAEQRYI